MGEIAPRGLTKKAAAEYLSLSVDGFDHWVAQGRIPGPIPGTQRWDKRAIDLALDRAGGLQSPSAFESWRRGRGNEGENARG